MFCDQLTRNHASNGGQVCSGITFTQSGNCFGTVQREIITHCSNKQFGDFVARSRLATSRITRLTFRKWLADNTLHNRC